MMPSKALTFDPGASPGQVTINGNLTLDSNDTLVMEVNGSTTPGTDFDQFVVNGTVTLGGATLTTSGTVTSNPGQSLSLIDNDNTDAVNGTFSTLPGPVPLPEGSTVTINGVNFTISYAGGTGGDHNNVTLTQPPATVSIAGLSDASEPGPSSVKFTVTQTAASPSDTDVTFHLSGTATANVPTTPLRASVTIPAGSTSATITMPVINDAVVEPTETVTVTLVSPITSGNAVISVDTTAASRNITDNDSATVSVAGTLNGSETGPTNATFTVTQTAISSTDTVVAFTLGGTASEGSDYTAITHSVTIPAGSTTATITIPVINDAVVEPTETVTVTLVSPITSGNAGISVDTTAASRNITDNDSATVSVAGTLNGSETGPTNATFTVTQTAISSTDTVVSFTLGDGHGRFRLHRHHALGHDSCRQHHRHDHDPGDQRRRRGADRDGHGDARLTDHQRQRRHQCGYDRRQPEHH